MRQSTAYCRLRQVYADGTEALSAVQTVSGPLSNVYPNPAHDNLWVELPAAITARYRILSSVGTAVATSSLPSMAVLLVAHLPAGLYYLEIITADSLATHRFVKQ